MITEEQEREAKRFAVAEFLERKYYVVITDRVMLDNMVDSLERSKNGRQHE